MSEIVRDAHGNQLNDGDAVTVVKDLKVKGSSVVVKRGTLVKGIRLTGNPEEIEASIPKVKGLVLRTEFLKRA
ncbi:alkylphosphonate utilization protein [Pelagibacterium sp.]|uniref:alkylphosphonate utilization protein n=1 Tax=Pelagibacterium sp. TaxID=1967288 RepID=UPI003A908B13